MSGNTQKVIGQATGSRVQRRLRRAGREQRVRQRRRACSTARAATRRRGPEGARQSSAGVRRRRRHRRTTARPRRSAGHVPESAVARRTDRPQTPSSRRARQRRARARPAGLAVAIVDLAHHRSRSRVFVRDAGARSAATTAPRSRTSATLEPTEAAARERALGDDEAGRHVRRARVSIVHREAGLSECRQRIRTCEPDDVGHAHQVVPAAGSGSWSSSRRRRGRGRVWSPRGGGRASADGGWSCATRRDDAATTRSPHPAARSIESTRPGDQRAATSPTTRREHGHEAHRRQFVRFGLDRQRTTCPLRVVWGEAEVSAR